jgi:signal transduction histidine kinase
VVASTGNVAGAGRLFTFRPAGTVSVRSVKHVDVSQAADSYRVAVAATGDGRLVYAAVPDDDEREAVRRLLGTVAIGLPVVVGVLTLITWILVGRALRPVEVANRRQREFVADAAHELRSPLAAMRTQLEVSAAHPNEGSWQQAIPVLLADVERMTRLADDLLQLARLDDRARAAHRVLDLDDIVFAEVTRVRTSAPVDIDTTGVSAAQVNGDGMALARLVGNVLDNAVRHAETRVTVALSVEEATAVLAVADDGPGVPAADRERIFERFTRLDDARSRVAGGAGLGLAIVREVARAHGGSASVADAQPGAVFVVRLPIVTSTGELSDDRPQRPVAQPDARPAR